ncbi:type I-B CRISPR-associated protein Cas7/Csh2 [Desulforudis sp. DRI-14]|uniref:type I-B CRISPR-associated protein Cas7/Csh2 n=1 Tax=Desulforudis sp. DRI-14 TaxID=3459793 RepID=UPI0040413760
MSVIDKNSEILFLYDAKMCNPNGDPDDENRPRFDPDRERCLVSDVRLKRYIREYLEDKGYTIYVTKAEGVVQAEKRVKQVLDKEDVSGADLPALLAKLIDVRLFGATMPLKEAKEPVSVTGPVQFAWGYSLNRVQMVDSVTISSQFATKEGAGQGTFGKDYRLYYALIGFHGVVSARRAQAMLARAGGKDGAATSEADLALMDEALVQAIPLLATRSKIGQYPRLYARFVFADAETFMGGDPREDLTLSATAGLRAVGDYSVEIGGLAGRLHRVGERLDHVVVWQDPALKTTADGREVSLAEWLGAALGAGRVRPWERT